LRSRCGYGARWFGAVTILLCASFSLACADSASANWSATSTVTGSGAQYGFGQDVGADGRGAVVWSSPAQGGDGFAIHERAVSRAGALGSTREVSEAPAGAAYSTAYHPTIRFAADGTATIVWLESSYSSQSCFAGGEGEDEPCEVDEYVRSRQVEPGGALAPQIHVLYHRHAVYPTGGPFGGSSPAYVAYGQPAIAGGPGSALTVVWGQSSFSEGCQGYAYSSSYHDGGCEAEATIQWVRLNAAGEAQGAPQAAYTSTTTGYGSGQPLLRLRVGAGSDGTATVLFSVRVQAEESQCWGGESAIEVLQIGTGGQVGSSHELDSGCGSIDPRLVVQPDDSALAAWGWEGTYTSDEALFTRIGTDGVPAAAEPLLDDYEGTRIGGIDLARGPAGSARAVWSDDGTIVSAALEVGDWSPVGNAPFNLNAWLHYRQALAERLDGRKWSELRKAMRHLQTLDRVHGLGDAARPFTPNDIAHLQEVRRQLAAAEVMFADAV
jgi:hypothetical protein